MMYGGDRNGKLLAHDNGDVFDCLVDDGKGKLSEPKISRLAGNFFAFHGELMNVKISQDNDNY